MSRASSKNPKFGKNKKKKKKLPSMHYDEAYGGREFKSRMKTIKLNKGQASTVRGIVKLINNDLQDIVTYSGGAGTGKTSLVPALVQKLKFSVNEILFLAFTGQAASNLTLRTGLPAHTIHSQLFRMVDTPLIIDGKPVEKNGRTVTTSKFVPINKKDLPESVKCIFLDESGCVDKSLAEVVNSMGRPVITSGDVNQLSHPSGPSPYMDKVDFMLTEVMRQSKDSNILDCAYDILYNTWFNQYNFKNYGPDAMIIPMSMLTAKMLREADIVLCNTNKVRQSLNDKIRKLKGFEGPLPNVGEQLICRQNNKSEVLGGVPLVNGTIGRCVNHIKSKDITTNGEVKTFKMDFQPSHSTVLYYEDLLCDYDFMTNPITMDKHKRTSKFNVANKLEFAYAITVYLSQGAQFNNVIYIADSMGGNEYMRKAGYTAATRAVKSFIMVVPGY